MLWCRALILGSTGKKRLLTYFVIQDTYRLMAHEICFTFCNTQFNIPNLLTDFYTFLTVLVWRISVRFSTDTALKRNLYIIDRWTMQYRWNLPLPSRHSTVVVLRSNEGRYTIENVRVSFIFIMDRRDYVFMYQKLR